MGCTAVQYSPFLKIMKKEIIKKIKRIIIITAPIWGLLLANILVELHLKHFCIIKWITNHECLGCGMTRAFAALSRLDFQSAYNYNSRIVIFVPILILIWGLMIYYEFRNDKTKY